MQNAAAEVGTDTTPTPRVVSPSARPAKAWPFCVIAVALAAGVALRAWFLFHQPVTSDEAVVGLIARDILHGHTNAFVWTQTVGGVEPYVVAGFFLLFGQGSLGLLAAPVALSVAAALLVWRVCLRLVRDPKIAALAGALAWAGPLPAVFLSTVEGGYRGVTLLCGLTTLLFALRILDGHRGYSDWLVLGLAAGIGWWALPEIVYFLVPAGLLVVASLVSARWSWRQWVPKVGASGAAAALGALPWLWANAGSGFASLNEHSFAGSSSPSNPGFGGRLEIFFKDGLPLQLDLRRFDIGTFLFGGSGSSPLKAALMGILVALVVVVVVGATALCFLRAGRAAALGLGVLVYPFLVAAEPGTWFWIDGRYTVYTGCLLALVLAVGCEEASERRRRRTRGPTRAREPVGRAVLAAIVLASVALTAYDFHQSFGVSAGSFASNWQNPDRPTLSTIAALERADVRTGYAGYWVAYKFDLLSDDRLALTVASPDPVRSSAIDHQVRTSAHPAWLFVRPSEIALAETQLGSLSQIQGPGGLPETSFLATLRHDRVRFRVVDAGMLEAVIPARRINPPLR